jgi:hypothetical protein
MDNPPLRIGFNWGRKRESWYGILRVPSSESLRTRVKDIRYGSSLEIVTYLRLVELGGPSPCQREWGMDIEAL